MPAAPAARVRSERGVMPGSVLSSRKTGSDPPGAESGGTMKSLRE